MKSIILFLLLFIYPGSYAYSQGTDGGQAAPQTAPDQAPQNQQQSQQPSDYPDYIVKPKEDLNPYGMSSLGQSTTDTSRDAAGTLGTGTARPSNMELNKEIEGKRKENLKEAPKEGEQETKIDYDAAYPTEEKYQDIINTREDEDLSLD